MMSLPRPDVIKSRYLPVKDAPLPETWFNSECPSQIEEQERRRLSKLSDAFPDYDERTLARIVQSWSRSGHSEDRRVVRILSPISLIPNEILLQIFKLYIYCSSKWYSSLPMDAFRDVEFAPWLLSQVCLKWRQLAFRSSSLWKTVRLDCEYKRKSPLPFRRTAEYKNSGLHLISRQLILSKEQLLNVTVDIASLVFAYPDLLGVLLPHVHRWKRLDIFRGSSSDLDLDLDAQSHAELREGVEKVTQEFFPACETQLEYPLLDDIRISIHDLPSFHLPNNIRFPRLTKAFFWGFASLPSNVTVPWSHLTELELPWAIKASKLIPALPPLIGLKSLKVGIILEDRREDTLPLQVNLLPSMEVLATSRGFAPLMEAVDLPSLKHLTIGDLVDEEMYIDYTDDLLALAKMAGRSSPCPVSFLHMILPISSDPSLDLWLSTLSALKGIQVDLYLMNEDPDYHEFEAYISDFADALSLLDSDGNLAVCPGLETIVVRDRIGDAFDAEDMDDLLDMLEIRCGFEDFSLKSVNVYGAFSRSLVEYSEDVCRRLDALKERGLDFTVWC